MAHVCTLLYEVFRVELAKFLPDNRITKRCDINDQKLWLMLSIYTELSHQKADYSGVTQVGTDKTAARKSYHYLTLCVDVQKDRTLYVISGKDSQTVASFCSEFQEYEWIPKHIIKLACDMSPHS